MPAPNAPGSPDDLPATLPELPGVARCFTCKFFLSLPKNSGSICRRYPPIVTLLAVPAPQPPGVIPRRGEPVQMTFVNQPLWSPVGPGDWCGEYVRNPAIPKA